MDKIKNISNMKVAQQKAKNYLGQNTILYISDRKDKKYYVINPSTQQKIHFGSNMEDFTFHKDLKRRDNYLKRSAGIKGDWKNDKYSPNNLSRNILW